MTVSTKLPELREILRQNKIKGYSHYNKKQLVELLKGKGLLPEEPPKPEKPKKEIDPRFIKLNTIRTNPKRVALKNIETGDILTFPSIYKASRFINTSPRIITFWNGRVWNNKYEIRVWDSGSAEVLSTLPREGHFIPKEEDDPVMKSIENLEIEINKMYDDVDKLCDKYLDEF